MSKSNTEIKSIWKPGDHVYVKPSQHTRCDVPWKPAKIESVISEKIVKIKGGANRHVADIRRRFISNEDKNQSTDEELESQNNRRTYARENIDSTDSEILGQNNDDEENAESEEVTVNGENVEEEGTKRSNRLRRKSAYFEDYVNDS